MTMTEKVLRLRSRIAPSTTEQKKGRKDPNELISTRPEEGIALSKLKRKPFISTQNKLKKSTSMAFSTPSFSLACKWASVGLRLFVLLALAPAVLSKRTRGSFKLSGEYSEHVMSSFAVSHEGARATFRIGTDEMYENEAPLKLHVYKDDVWPAFQRAPLCTDKIKLAAREIDLSFHFKGDGPLVPKGGKYQAVKTIMLGDPEGDDSKLDRTTYFYFVVDDCSLERYLHDAKIPKLNFEINTWNYMRDKKRNTRRTTQLGADESNLFDAHAITATVAGLALAWLFFNMTARLARKKNNNTVHAAVLWIGVSVGLDLISSICILFHMEVYHYNGVGIYLLDAVAAHLESLCDASLTLFLMSIAAGWTLPSDVVGINPGANSMSAMLADLSRPLAGVVQFNAVGIFAVSVVAMHTILAQWGRMYNDDFESYHDFANLPGKILMGMRCVLGFCYLGITLQTRLHCKVHQLQTFYAVIAVLGFFWFEMPPVLTFFCNWFFPYYMQREAVFMGCTFLQSTYLVLLAWLVTSHATIYHQYSHMSTNEKAPTLTESLAASHGTREWKLLGKAKVRLD